MEQDMEQDTELTLVTDPTQVMDMVLDIQVTPLPED
jgi:hypothetical protein